MRYDSWEWLSRRGNLAERQGTQSLRPKVIYIAKVAGLPKEDLVVSGSCLLLVDTEGRSYSFNIQNLSWGVFFEERSWLSA